MANEKANGSSNSIATLRAEVDGLKADVGEIGRKLDQIISSRGVNWQAVGIVITAIGLCAGLLGFIGEMRVGQIHEKIQANRDAITESKTHWREDLKGEHADLVEVWRDAQAKIGTLEQRFASEMTIMRDKSEANAKNIAVLDRDAIEVETQFGRFADAINVRFAIQQSQMNQERRESGHEPFDDPAPWVAFEKIKGTQ